MLPRLNDTAAQLSGAKHKTTTTTPLIDATTMKLNKADNDTRTSTLPTSDMSVHETDASSLPQYKVHWYDFVLTFLSIVQRLVGLVMNFQLAKFYYDKNVADYFVWTVCCIAISMLVTTMIHFGMLYQDGKFNGCLQTLKAIFSELLPSFFLRYLVAFVYTVRCKQAECLNKSSEQQEHNYKLLVREESDVALIRLFECFIETAPQKILLICIVLAHREAITYNQIYSLVMYFIGTAWSLALYQRCIRFNLPNKKKISWASCAWLLAWHFSISSARSVCIALIAYCYPLWTLIGCLVHILLSGLIIYVVEQPRFAGIANNLCNFLVCLAMGTVHLFTFISVRDGRTRYKYLLFYSVCILENLLSGLVLVLFGAVPWPGFFVLLCLLANCCYFVGIGFMIVYYRYYHPKEAELVYPAMNAS